MATSAILLQLLAVKEQINYYTAQQMFYTNKYNSNHKTYTELSKRVEGWETKHDDVEGLENGKKKTINGVEYTNEQACCAATSFIYHVDCSSESAAEEYYQDDLDEQVELEYLDMEYDAQKTLFDTMLETLQADEENLKQQLSEEAQDTHLLGQ